MNMSINRITLLRQCTANTTFSTYLVIGPSRDRFAIHWFETNGRRDVVKNFETSGLLQIELRTARVRVFYYRMIAGSKSAT